MKKCLCALFALLMALCITSALAEGCKYEGQGSPCDVKWWVDTVEREHCRACFYHVEDKEDINSHVQITDWTPCTLDEGGECTGCGWDYDRSDNEPTYEEFEMYMLEFYMMLTEINGTAPVDVSVSGNQMTVALTDEFFMYMDDWGVPYPESMRVATTFTLSLPGGINYPVTGSAVTPEVEVVASAYGPGALMRKQGLLQIGAAAYSDNTQEGTAKATVQVSVEGGNTYNLSTNFTVGGMAGDYCESGPSGCKPAWQVDNDAMQHRRVCMAHLMDKGDMGSYTEISGWESCTVDEESGECPVCGWEYEERITEEDYDMVMVENYARVSAETKDGAVNVSISGDSLTISMKDKFFEYVEAAGVPVAESMKAATTYTLVLPDGEKYPATGEAVTPEVIVNASEYGPGAWLDRYVMVIENPVYEKNVEPGTATVSVRFVFKMGNTYTLSKNFTIEKMAERVPGDADGDGAVGLADALAILQQSASVNTRNADVNGDGTVDIQDALRIFQREAGWDVKLQ